MPFKFPLEQMKKQRLVYSSNIAKMKHLALKLAIRELGGQTELSDALSLYHGFTVSQPMISKAVRSGKSVEKISALLSPLMYELQRTRWPHSLITSVIAQIGYVPTFYHVVKANDRYGIVCGFNEFSGKPYVNVAHSLDVVKEYEPKVLEFL